MAESQHTPWACYPSAGWEIVSSIERPLIATGVGDDGATLMELVVDQAGERRLVHFWYATHRSTAIATDARLTLDHMLGRIWGGGRADGALVRISTPVDSGGVERARQRLQAIAGPFVREISARWPEPG